MWNIVNTYKRTANPMYNLLITVTYWAMEVELIKSKACSPLVPGRFFLQLNAGSKNQGPLQLKQPVE